MREYTISRCPSYDAVDWSSVPTAPIDCYRWADGGYEPTAGAQVVLIENTAFVARLWAKEAKPMAKRRHFFDDVWCDSCLEWFAAFDGERNDYLNIEMNARGVSHVAFGRDRYERTRLTDLVAAPFDVRATERPDRWSVTVTVPLDKIEKIFGVQKERFVPDYSFRGNFYKCGDETKIPHFGMWNEVLVPDDFHQPDYFGRLIIGK